MKIIAITGMPFAGKTEAVQIAEQLKIPVVRMGDTIWDEVKKRGLEFNDKTVGTVASEMRKIYGMAIWAQRTVDRVQRLNHAKYIVIDGVRNPEEVDYFKKELGSDFVMIAITASDDVRRKRSLSRKRIDDCQTPVSFEERDKRELRWGLGEVISLADIVIPNEHDLKSFGKQVKHVLQHL
jgi:dephospho-CoA kinase